MARHPRVPNSVRTEQLNLIRIQWSAYSPFRRASPFWNGLHVDMVEIRLQNRAGKGRQHAFEDSRAR
jgi:hypothetical protein